MSQAATASPRVELNDRELIRRVNALRKLDNLTNWLYIAREYFFLAGVVGLTIAFYHYRPLWDLHWAWNVPVSLLAIIFIGAGQHRLTNIGHEASHYMLFRNRLLNELASDWFAMFAVWSTTHHYRLQHLAHHQFPNDPERDPDVLQMTNSGHRYRFPMPKLRFLWECVFKPLLWFPSLVRYVRGRAKFGAMGSKTGPYAIKRPVSRILIPATLLYVATLAATVTICVIWEKPFLLAVAPAGLWLAALCFYGFIPGRMYSQATIKPDVPLRWQTMMRISYLSLLFVSLGWLSYWTGKPWGLYYIVLWLVPLGTTFGFFMLLRQIVQHGNADQGRFSNTRIFNVGRLIRFAVFPWGMDYHLPHHLFPMVPHYRLRQLHALLSGSEEYRRRATLVDGYFLPSEKPPVHPTVLDLMASQATRS